jgi:hypothetical protein
VYSEALTSLHEQKEKWRQVLLGIHDKQDVARLLSDAALQPSLLKSARKQADLLHGEIGGIEWTCTQICPETHGRLRPRFVPPDFAANLRSLCAELGD